MADRPPFRSVDEPDIRRDQVQAIGGVQARLSSDLRISPPSALDTFAGPRTVGQVPSHLTATIPSTTQSFETGSR